MAKRSYPAARKPAQRSRESYLAKTPEGRDKQLAGLKLGRRFGGGQKGSVGAGKWCYLYLFRIHNQPLYKIGISASPISRRVGIQTSTPLAIEAILIVGFRSRTSAVAAESAIHDSLVSCHVRGEWYTLLPTELEKVLLIYLSYITCPEGS